MAVIGMGLGLAPPLGPIEVGALTRWLTRLCGGLGPATEQLVNRWAVSLFGPYRCYQRASGLTVKNSEKKWALATAALPHTTKRSLDPGKWG